MLARRIGLVFCGILLAASGAAGVLNGPGVWRNAETAAGHWLGAMQMIYGAAGFAVLWGLLRPGRWIWPVFGAWAVAVVAATSLATLAASQPAARWLLTTSAVIVSTVFVGAVVGYARRALTTGTGPGHEPEEPVA